MSDSAPILKEDSLSQQIPQIAEQTAEALVQAQLVAYNQRDLASFVALFSDDVCIYRPPPQSP
ncbi:steroid delta-isomerase domain protein [Shewanella decolorationis S12]|uniref:Steroid delta-isomerase domain protein n=1 Tax=Shewanella decolorationis S12 TaxID=1353536 RepID=A0ABN0PIW4_9GAMM|nr:steroid delta-isomerase domain protein [Shewanella decolorationis S12]